MAIDLQALGATTGLLGSSGVTGASRDQMSQMGLGKDAFLKLFLAQLKNQDPANPASDRDFIAQLAQFTVLETMQQMREAMAGAQLAQSASLIGKYVEGTADDGSPIAGLVERVLHRDGDVDLVVGGRTLALDAVSHVAPTAPTTEDEAT